MTRCGRSDRTNQGQVPINRRRTSVLVNERQNLRATPTSASTNDGRILICCVVRASPLIITHQTGSFNVFPGNNTELCHAVATRDEPDTIHTCCFELLIVGIVLQETQTETGRDKSITWPRPFYFASGRKCMHMLIDQVSKDIKKIHWSLILFYDWSIWKVPRESIINI